MNDQSSGFHLGQSSSQSTSQRSHAASDDTFTLTQWDAVRLV